MYRRGCFCRHAFTTHLCHPLNIFVVLLSLKLTLSRHSSRTGAAFLFGCALNENKIKGILWLNPPMTTEALYYHFTQLATAENVVILVCFGFVYYFCSFVTWFLSFPPLLKWLQSLQYICMVIDNLIQSRFIYLFIYFFENIEKLYLCYRHIFKLRLPPKYILHVVLSYKE